MKYHYDCFLWKRGKLPMTFCWDNKQKAISECKKLLGLNTFLRHERTFAKIEARPLHVIRLTRSIPKCPVIWRGESRQYTLVTRRMK